ncbi:FAD-dependent oxidoreductase [Nakamurella silvestris]|nr:FAD-dependent oxidoreductase [Nakamurella silvestris]
MASVADVVVVGGGAAGLTTAYELTRRGRHPLVLEAGPAVGGVVSGHRVADLPLDAGAESFALARPAVGALINDLGLSSQVCAPRSSGAWVRYDTGQAPLPRGGWLGVPVDPFAADVLAVIGEEGARRADLDRHTPIGELPADLTLGALVRERMGETVLRRLVEPVVGGVHSVDPDLLEIRSIAPTVPALIREHGSLTGAAAALRGAVTPAGSAVAGLVGGMHTLTAALGGAIVSAGGRIQTRCRVSAVRPDADGWTVDTDRGVLRAREVVIALPAPAAAALLRPHLPGLDWPTVTIGTAVRLATLVVDRPALDEAPRGTGILVSAHAPGVTAKALTHATAKWDWLAREAGPGRHVLRLSYGRGAVSAQALPAANALIDLALADATELLGVDLDRRHLVGSAVVTWTDAQPPAAPGRAAAVAAITAAAATLPGLQLAGAWIAGTGLAAVVGQARNTGARMKPPHE